MRFDAGKVKLSAAGSLAHDFRSAVFSGEASFDELAAAAYGKAYRDFSAQCAFSCYMPNMRLVEFRTLNFYLRRAGKPALRLECPGSWDLGKESYAGEWAVRYLNEQFLTLLDPSRFSEAQLTGKVQVSAPGEFRCGESGRCFRPRQTRSAVVGGCVFRQPFADAGA